MSSHRYWVVGAMYGGKDDQFDAFISEGRWSLGWDDSEQPAQHALLKQIRRGDRIAIKRMLGQGATEIEIRALGIVTRSADDDRTVGVRWIVSDLRRTVPANGYFQSIRKPVDPDDEWARQVFQL